MKMGAFDYITKLFPDEILVTIKKALETRLKTGTLFARTGCLRASPVKQFNSNSSISPAAAAKDKGAAITFSGDYIFGDTPVFRQLLQQIDLWRQPIIPSSSTAKRKGKEAIAQEIHKRSKRKSRPFVAIDCGACRKNWRQ
jgi:two-component system response regulator HydG